MASVAFGQSIKTVILYPSVFPLRLSLVTLLWHWQSHSSTNTSSTLELHFCHAIYFSYGARKDQNCSGTPRANLTQIKCDALHVSVLIDDIVVWCPTVSCCTDNTHNLHIWCPSHWSWCKRQSNQRLEFQSTQFCRWPAMLSATVAVSLYLKLYSQKLH